VEAWIGTQIYSSHTTTVPSQVVVLRGISRHGCAQQEHTLVGKMLTRNICSTLRMQNQGDSELRQ
jgi:hypothetical protein